MHYVRSVLPLLLLAACTSGLPSSSPSSTTGSALSTTIANGGFESGLTGWTSAGATSVSSTAHAGVSSAQVGSTGPSTDSSLSQSFTAPAGATLSFYYRVVCPDTVTYDWATATLQDTTANTTATLLAKTCSNTGVWTKVTSAALTAGHNYTLTLANHDDNYSSDPTYTLYDDVVLTGAVANDFSVAVSPASGTVAAGSSTTFTVTTAVTAGAAQSVSLAASGLPAGVTGSFNPASVTAGGSSTLTVTASSSAAAATATFTVTGSATSGTHSATASLTVTVPPPPSSGILNGGFENGLTSWTSTGLTSVSTTAHTGTKSAMVGSASPSTDSSVAQTFTAPSGAGALSFWFQVVCPDTVQYDWATATLKDNTAATSTILLSDTCSKTGTWAQVTSAALTAGHSYTLTLANHDDNYSADPTYTLYDDVVLGGAPPPPSDFTLAVSPSSATVNAGSSTSFTVSTTATGTAQTISLSASGLPAGVTASFSPASITAGQSSTLTLSAAASAASATATITVTGTGTTVHSATASLTVNGAPPANDFSVAVSPASQTVAPGASVAYTVSTTLVSGSAQSISLSVSGLPSGVTGSFSPTSVSSGQSSTLTLAAAAGAAANSGTVFTVTGAATSGSRAATATVAVSSASTGVGPNGGSVDHLFFAVVGDTRPGSLDGTSSYPTAIITKIYQDIQAMNPRPQFVVGTGDYMFASTTGGQAAIQIGYYTQAQSNYTGTSFCAMGNHECDGYTADNCTPGQTDNYNQFMSALVTPLGKSTPYYSIPVRATDNSWTAKLLIIACNQWDAAQKSWLTSQLASATTYTILARHEPAAATTGPCVNDVESLMTTNPYNLSLVGHTHTFRLSSKEIIVGTGGAPITTSGVPYGYATVEKVATGWQVKQYDYSNGLAINTYVVP